MMKDIIENNVDLLSDENRKEIINEIRQLFFKTVYEDSEQKEQFDELDIEKLKNYDWFIERHLMNTNWKKESALENLIENLKWRKEFGVNQLKEEDFPAEFYKSGSFFDYENDKYGHSVIYIRGRLHRKILEWTPLFKKFFVFIVNKVENKVYFNSEKQNKVKSEQNINGIDELIIDKENDKKNSLNNLQQTLDKKKDEHLRPNGFSVFWDCQGAGLANVDMDILSFMVKTITTNFPLGLCHVFVYELPWILQAISIIVKSWIPEYYLNAIVFVKKSDLNKYIDVNNLPSYLGGACEKKTNIIPKNTLTAEQIGIINNISLSNIKKIQKHIESHCESAE